MTRKPIVSAAPPDPLDLDNDFDVWSEFDQRVEEQTQEALDFEEKVTEQAEWLRARREASRRVAAEERGSDPAEWKPIDLAEVWDDAEKVREPEVARMFYSGAVNSVYGPSESGKTWIALLGAAEVLANGGSVVMLDFEDVAASMVRRLRLLGVGRKEVRRFTYVSPTSYDEAGRDALADAVSAAELVIVDATTEALAAMGGLSSNSDVDIAEFMAALPKWCARRGPAVVVIDHATKESARSGVPEQQGSQHKRAAVDGASYSVTPHKPFSTEDEEGDSYIHVGKDKHGGVKVKRTGKGRYFGHLVGGALGYRIVPPAPEDDSVTTPGDDNARVLSFRLAAVAAVRDADPPLKSKNSILAAVRVTGLKFDDGAAKRAIDDLVAEGVLSGGWPSPYVAHVPEPAEEPEPIGEG